MKLGVVAVKKGFLSKCIFIAFLLFLAVVSICERLHTDISKEIVRLHIVANSDNEYDQNVKLKVRDAVIMAQKEIFDDGIKKELTKTEREKLISVVNEALANNGAHYGADIQTGKFYFPTKEYANITLPAGNYDAVRVVLGEAKGQNWWCVMYPPLCFSEIAIGKAEEESIDILKESMTEFEYEIISEESIKTVPAFKLVETWEKLKEKIRNSL